jgi:hypothetical protein
MSLPALALNLLRLAAAAITASAQSAPSNPPLRCTAGKEQNSKGNGGSQLLATVRAAECR